MNGHYSRGGLPTLNWLRENKKQNKRARFKLKEKSRVKSKERTTITFQKERKRTMKIGRGQWLQARERCQLSERDLTWGKGIGDEEIAGGVFRPEMTTSQLAMSAEDDGHRVNVIDRQMMMERNFGGEMTDLTPNGGLPIWKLDALVTWLGPLVDVTWWRDLMEVVRSFWLFQRS